MSRALAFTLPPELEASAPPEARDAVRLMVARGSGPLTHTHFTALPGELRAGDLLVVNESATLPAALPATKASVTPRKRIIPSRLSCSSVGCQASTTGPHCSGWSPCR